MANPVFKMYTGKFTEAWHQLPQEARQELLRKVREALEEVGGEVVVLCSSWASQQYQFFGVEKYPSAEALQKHAALLAKLNWFRYIESVTQVGSEWKPSV
jgi:hypothetical protein